MEKVVIRPTMWARRSLDNDEVEMGVCGNVDKLDGRSLTGVLFTMSVRWLTARKMDYKGRAKDVAGVLEPQSDGATGITEDYAHIELVISIQYLNAPHGSLCVHDVNVSFGHYRKLSQYALVFRLTFSVATRCACSILIHIAAHVFVCLYVKLID